MSKSCFFTFKTTPFRLLSGKKGGCNICHGVSKGENEIARTLKQLSIDFEKQKKFADCKYKGNLYFDFYVQFYGKTYLIEYDGIQHFKPVDFFGGIEAFKLSKIRDKIKDDYCKNNDYVLLRIPYYNFDNISQILIDIFSDIKKSTI